MKVELFPFQQRALDALRLSTAEAMGSYHRTHTPQVVSFTAPTGAGKTIIIASLIEDIYFGDSHYAEQQNAIFVWLSDSPQLNEQSKLKIDTKADKIRLGQCVTVSEDSFDKETFEDGHIYFLNTQKLSVSSNLTKNGDNRTYTIWETIANTVREKNDRLYFIIDEAHRGMQGRKASRATTIMQKFIKGSDTDHIPPMPVVIGMSATTQRFNKLVENTSSTIQRVVVTADEVRASGLLKDRIIITYPEADAANNDMAILQAAADDWKEKWGHWTQYCQEQHYAYVNPVFIIQVLNGSGKKLSDTNLDDCLSKIEERVGIKFEPGQVVHTFGQTQSSVTINGLEVRYVEPSRIADDKNIRVVLFKENLSTGWDCPRAETMMSFRHASDATYIAQLLGRMVRTPMQMHIQVDDVLNDVHLFLPYFNENTVKDVVDELQNSEGGEIPTDIYGETTSGHKFDTLTVKRSHKKNYYENPNQVTFEDYLPGNGDSQPDESGNSLVGETRETFKPASDSTGETVENVFNTSGSESDSDLPSQNDASPENKTVDTSTSLKREKETLCATSDINNSDENTEESEDLFDREAVMKFINDSGLLTYDVRTFQINNYLKSLFKLAHLLTMSNLRREAILEVRNNIAEMIHMHVESLKKGGTYNDLVLQVKQFKLETQIFDAFGESIDNYSVHNLFTTTDTDLERQFCAAEAKLGNEGIGVTYANKYGDLDDPAGYEIDVILFVADDECMNQLHNYAEKRFHELNDEYRRYIAKIDSEKIRKQYDSIVSDGDKVSKHNFRLPETIQVPHDIGGKEYRDHLFVNDDTGVAKLKLNSWESGVIAEEEKRDDFVCWIRNPSRGSWALCIPYEEDGVTKPTYPDFIVVRRDNILGYVIDILEPHNPDYKDNLGKAKGFAEYARQNPGLGRIQLIRKSKDSAGNEKFKRLDMAKSAIREKVLKAMSVEELDHLVDTDGQFDF
jgi:type III restriction enzyme